MSSNSSCGFITAVLSLKTSPPPTLTKESEGSHNGKFDGIFLISKSNNKPKRTNNRKYVSHDNRFDFGVTSYKVNVKPSGIYTPMMIRAIKQLEAAQSLWGRVLVVRLDLHQSCYRKDSKHVSWFFKQLTRKLKAHYQLDQVGYFWAREQERALAQHYHVWLFLDGRKIKHSSKVIKMAKSIWMDNWAGQHHIPTTKKPFRLVNDEASKHEVVYWLSYGCKARGKGYRPPQSKDYGASRLKKRELFHTEPMSQ